jgi:hypothetical protein
MVTVFYLQIKNYCAFFKEFLSVLFNNATKAQINEEHGALEE